MKIKEIDLMNKEINNEYYKRKVYCSNSGIKKEFKNIIEVSNYFSISDLNKIIDCCNGVIKKCNGLSLNWLD